MITVHTRHLRTGEETEHHFKTDLGAYQHTRAMIYDHTNLPQPIATDIATILTDKQFKISQRKIGQMLFTIHRSRA